MFLRERDRERARESLGRMSVHAPFSLCQMFQELQELLPCHEVLSS
jgi:hypothetical protein